MKKIAVITGGSSGLGLALTVILKKEYSVVNVSRSVSTEAEFNIQVDLTSPDAAQKVFKELSSRFESIDLLINNSGIGAYGTFEELTEKELRAIMELDFFVPIKLTGILLPLLEKSKGTIINIASMAAKIHVPAMGAYCAAKGALAMYSETLRVELLSKKIRVLTVYPGRINTGFSSRAIKYREVPDTPGNSSILPEDFALAVMKAIKTPKCKRCFFPWWYRPGVWFARLFENFYNRKNIEYWKL